MGRERRLLAVMQPTYLPWIGYFDLVDQADVFVLLDTAQFSYQSWHHRNRIPTERGLEWLTVPVQRKGRLGKPLADIRIGESAAFPRDTIRLLQESYVGVAHHDVIDAVTDRLGSAAAGQRLVDVTIPIIDDLAARLDITVPIVRSSDLDVAGRRSELLVSIARAVGATTYLSPHGALAYLAEDRGVFDDAGIPVLVQHYEHPVYPQLRDPFLPFASAIDLLANTGADASAIMRSGRRPPIALDDALEEIDAPT